MKKATYGTNKAKKIGTNTLPKHPARPPISKTLKPKVQAVKMKAMDAPMLGGLNSKPMTAPVTGKKMKKSCDGDMD
jgi:hypothetical protein